MDTSTLEWTNLIFFLLYAAVMLVSAGVQDRTPGSLYGARWFASSNLARAVTMVLLLLPASQLTSSFVADVLTGIALSCGLVTLHCSFAALLGKHKFYVREQIGIALFGLALGLILHMVGVERQELRALLGAVIALQTAVTAWMLFRESMEGVHLSAYFTASLLAVYSLLLVWQSAAVLTEGSAALGEIRKIWLVASLILNGGTAFGFVFMAMSLLRLELMRQAQRDPLTGLLNRRGLAAALEQEIASSQLRGQALSILTLDLDAMKESNDLGGHAAGDKLLVGVAEYVVDSLRSYDSVARAGGDEFIILLPAAELEDAARIAERLRHGISRVLVSEGDRLLGSTASFGVAALRPGEPPDQLLLRSDRALYRAKHEGKNRVCVAEAPVARSQPHMLAADGYEDEALTAS